MRKLSTSTTSLCIFLVVVCGNRALPETTELFEGKLTTQFTRSGLFTNELSLTRNANLLRIENNDKSQSEPVNIVELDSGQTTILFPINSTFVRFDPVKITRQASPFPGGVPPAGAGANPAVSGPAFASQIPTPQKLPSVPSGISAQRIPGASPDVPAPPTGFPAPPPNFAAPSAIQAAASGAISGRAQRLPVSHSSFASAFSGAAPSPALPSTSPLPMVSGPPNPGGPMPMATPQMPMPGMPMFGQQLTLTKTSANKTIHVFECTLYTLTNRFDQFEVWATADSSLFPFRLLERDYPRRQFGPRRLEDEWVELLRKESLFPMEATLRNAAGAERFSFKVVSVTRKKFDETASRKLFTVPSGFSEIEAPPF